MALNIILDITFVAVVHMGIAGAAIATVISQFFSWIACLLYMNYKYPEFRINMAKLKFENHDFISGY